MCNEPGEEGVQGQIQKINWGGGGHHQKSKATFFRVESPSPPIEVRMLDH